MVRRAVFGFAKDEVAWPHYLVGPTACALSRGHDGIKSSDAAMNYLRLEGTVKSPANNQHDGPVHQRPESQHEPVVILGRSSQFLRQAFAQ